MKKIILTTGLIVGLLFSVSAFAGRTSSQRVFVAETVAGVTGLSGGEVATSSAYNIDGITDIGFDYLVAQGTSTPQISIGYQTSMQNSTWTATTDVTGVVTTTDYTATGTAVTITPTEWIRWILSTEIDNATNTAVSLWFKMKNEGRGN